MTETVYNLIQVLNEAVVLVCLWLMFHFTEFVPDPTIRYELGWGFLYFVAGNTGFNLLVLIYIIGKKIYQACRNLYLTKKAKHLANK